MSVPQWSDSARPVAITDKVLATSWLLVGAASATGLHCLAKIVGPTLRAKALELVAK